MCFVLFRSAHAFRCPNYFDTCSGKLIVHSLALVALGLGTEANIEASICHRLVPLLKITFDARQKVVVMIDACRCSQFRLLLEFRRISFA